MGHFYRFKRTRNKEKGGSRDGDSETLSLFWLASLFISRAHGCLLITTSERGASDPADSQGSSAEDAPGFGFKCLQGEKNNYTQGIIIEVLVLADKMYLSKLRGRPCLILHIN